MCACVRVHACVRPGREEGTSCFSSSGVQWPQMAFDLIKEHSLKTKQLSVRPAATVDKDEVTHTHTHTVFHLKQLKFYCVYVLVFSDL